MRTLLHCENATIDKKKDHKKNREGSEFRIETGTILQRGPTGFGSVC